MEQLAESGYYCVNVGKMHTWPYDTPMGFHERYVVENKDRYLEGRYYFDEWDKALQARGLVKQQREFYRELPDYAERLGAFEWELPEDAHPDMFVGDLACLLDRPASPCSKHRSFCKLAFPAPIRPTTRFHAMPNPTWRRSCRFSRLTLQEVAAPAAAVPRDAPDTMPR